jgi:hypothetical protein
MWTVEPQSLATIRVNLDETNVFNAGMFEPERLTAGTRAKL